MLRNQPTLEDLYQFLSRFTSEDRQKMVVVVGDEGFDGAMRFSAIDDIRLPAADLDGGKVLVVEDGDGPRAAIDAAEEADAITCFRIV